MTANRKLKRSVGQITALAALAFATALPLPALAQVQPDAQKAQAPARQSNIDFTTIDGGQRMQVNPKSNDVDVVNDLLNSGNKENANLAALIKFVDAEGGLFGAMQECDPHKASLFRLCAFTILDHWRDVTGHDLPKTQMRDGYRTTAEVVTAWRASAHRASETTRDSQSYCPAVENAIRSSSVWKYCTAPDWDRLTSTKSGAETPQDATPEAASGGSDIGRRER